MLLFGKGLKRLMNKDMLDRLRSAVCEGSQQSAELRPDKAAVQRWINDHFIASPPGVCAHCGGGERAGDPFVIMFVHLRSRRPAFLMSCGLAGGAGSGGLGGGRPRGERMTILGIDPGKSGTVAVLDEGGDLLEMHDMPSTLGSNGRSATNAPLLARILARTHARIAFCEFVGAR